jgi:hypothetical protein
MNLRCTSFAPMSGKSLQGFASVKIEDIGLEIRDIGLHSLDGVEWVTLPRKLFSKNGSKSYFHYCAFPDPRDRKQFGRLALAVIKDWCQREGIELC